MTPIIATSLASVATGLIDRWIQSAQNRVHVQADQFASALAEATEGKNASSGTSPGGNVNMYVESIKNQILNSSEAQTVLALQHTGKQVSLMVGADGKMWKNVQGVLNEVHLGGETQALVHKLSLLSPQTVVLSGNG